MNARASLQRLAREHALIDPDRDICGECNGSGHGDYGPCPDCEGIGSHPVIDERERHVRRRIVLNLTFNSGQSPAGEAAVIPPLQAVASNIHASKKVA